MALRLRSLTEEETAQIRQRGLDRNKRAELFKAIHKQMAKQLHYLPGVPGEWKDSSLVQPWVGNWGALQTWRYGISPFPCGTRPTLTEICQYPWDTRRA